MIEETQSGIDADAALASLIGTISADSVGNIDKRMKYLQCRIDSASAQIATLHSLVHALASAVDALSSRH